MANQISGAKVGLTADSYVGFTEETTWATKAGPDSTTEWVHIISENIQRRKVFIIPPNVDDAFEDSAAVFSSRELVTGDIEFAVPYAGIENVLLHTFGAVSAGTPTNSLMVQDLYDLTGKGRYKNSNSPGLTIHISRGEVETTTNDGLFHYTGCVITSATFSCDGANELRLRISFVGQTNTFDNATSSPTVTFPSAPTINGTEILPTWGAANFPTTNFSITIDRGIDQDRFFQGNCFTEEPPPGKTTVTGSFGTEWTNQTLNSTTMYNDWDSGQQRLLAWQGISSENSPTGAPWRFALSMESALLRDFPPNISSPGRIQVNVNFTGYDKSNTTTQKSLRIFHETESAHSE